MFCPKCGTKAIEGADFCQKCGARLIKDEPTRSAPIESSGPSAAPEGTAQVRQSVDTASPSVVQEAYNRLTATAGSFPKIKRITILGDPRSTSAMLSVCGTLNRCTYSQSKKTGELRASLWSIKLIAYLICAPILLCDALFLNSFFQGEYFPLLSILCLIGCFIWFPFAFLIYKEREEITAHIDRTLGREIKRPSKMLTIVSYVLNLIEIGLCIFSLVSVFGGSSDAPYYDSSNSSDVPYYDDSLPNLDEQGESISLTQVYTNEEEGISFMYPEDWTVTTATTETEEIVTVAAPEGMFGSYAYIGVSKDVADDMLFQHTMSDFERVYSAAGHINDISITSLTDITLGDFPARKLEFSANYDSADLIYIQYFYNLNSNEYIVTCVMRESSSDTYGPIFEAIMDSYITTATVPTVSTEYPGQIVFEGIPASSFLDEHIDTVIDNWGIPIDYNDSYGDNYCVYDAIEFAFDYEGLIFNVQMDAEHCTFDGTALNTTRDKLIEVLGNPTEEGDAAQSRRVLFEGTYYDVEVYYMTFLQSTSGMGIRIEFDKDSSTASYVYL